MAKKTIVLFAAFIFLIFFNIFISIKVNKHNQRIVATTLLLSSIEHSRDRNNTSIAAVPLVLGVSSTQKVEVADERAANLRAFFRSLNSPLYDYSDYLVKTADKYNMDYRLIPVISIQESGGCVHIPENSYNCWGWGIYGNIVTRFSSYEEAIDTVARGLKKEYIDKGLVTPEQIMSKYNPSSPNGSWATGVTKIWSWLD